MVTVFYCFFICLFAYLFHYMGFIEPLSDGLPWAEFYFLSVVGSGSVLLYFLFVSHLEIQFVAPGNKEIHFLLLWVHSISFLYKFNIAAILDSVVAPSNKNSISCQALGFICESNIGPLYSI